MKVRTRFLLEDCINNGIRGGINKAYKHIDNPDNDILASYIEQYIMNAIDEYFLFDEIEY